MGMAYQEIKVDKRDWIGVVTLNRPAELNTFTTRFSQELNIALRELDGDSDVRVVVIKGEGKHFSAGIDLKDMPGKGTIELRNWIRAMDEHNFTIARMEKPVIACVHGAAVANGMGLACACDLTIASEDAKFGTTAINVGLYCFGPSASLSRCVGKKRALELLLTGEVIDARKAFEWGLVNRVVPKEKLEEEAMAFARELAKKSPIALKMAKKSYYTMSNMGYDEALTYLGEAFTLLCCTEDAKEGVEAFLNKREPEWKER
jgi:enoyl-CoA hydratase/carnithine racemase